MTIFGLFTDSSQLSEATRRLAETDAVFKVVEKSAANMSPRSKLAVTVQSMAAAPASYATDMTGFDISAEKAEYFGRQVENGASLLIVEEGDEATVKQVIEDAGGVVTDEDS